MARKGLGRGLDAILGDDPSPRGARGSGVQAVPLADIAPDPDQPRKRFSEEALEELAASIGEKGILQPILVRPAANDADKFIIIAGERRWRAAGRAGLHEIPVLIRDEDEGSRAELALIENVQRTDLNPIEEALAYERMRTVFDRPVNEIARAVGKSRSHVANMVRLVALPDPVRQLVIDGLLTMGHARALLTAEDPERLAAKVVEKDLSVRETERLAKGGSAPKPRATQNAEPSAARDKDADTRSLEADLEATLGLSVAIEHGPRGGTLTVTYDTLDQLDDVCRRLMGSSI